MWNDQDTSAIWGWETANFVKLFSFSFTRKAQGHGQSRIKVCRIQFVHILLIDNKLLMDKIYFHYIYLSACIVEANERWHNWKAESTW